MHGKVAVVLFCTLLAGGCDSQFGVGGTGERVVPQETLRHIGGTGMEGLGGKPATTMPTTMPATQPAAEMKVSLEEARRAALANNLDLRVELLNPTIARQSISEEQARFESLFRVDASYGWNHTPNLVTNRTTGRTSIVGNKSEQLRTGSGIIVPLRTGGSVSLDAPVNWINPETGESEYSASPGISITQSLLRGAGTDVASQGIRIAFYQWQQSEARTKLEVIRVLADADRVYWRLYAARNELDVRKKEYDLAVEQLERARRLVRAGQKEEVEIVRAESGVADKLEQIIVAENNLRDRQRELKRILNIPGVGMESPTILIPTSRPNATYYTFDPHEVVQTAQNQRMELLEAELAVLQQSSNVRFARNATLPLVDLSYQYNLNGLGTSLDDSLTMVREGDFEDHRLGISVEVPIGNEAARSRLRRALASRMQALASRQLRGQLIEQEVLDALDQLEANFQRIVAARQRVLLAARVMEAETRQFAVGLRTSTEVLDAQTRLANAQSDEISALTEYQIAQVDLAFATGMVLGRSGVVWEPIAAPER